MKRLPSAVAIAALFWFWTGGREWLGHTLFDLNQENLLSQYLEVHPELKDQIKKHDGYEVMRTEYLYGETLRSCPQPSVYMILLRLRANPDYTYPVCIPKGGILLLASKRSQNP